MSIKLGKIDNTNNIDDMLKHIVNEKNKLEILTKKVMSNKVMSNKVMSNKVINKVINNVINNKNSNHIKTKQYTHKNNIVNTSKKDKTDIIIDNKEFDDLDFTQISPETSSKILELLKNYVNMDKSFRVKHESLKTLYNAYLDLHKKYKDTSNKDTSNKDIYNTNTSNTTTTTKNNSEAVKIANPEHKEILKNIHSEMKDNNSNLYNQRLIILKKIKETPDIHQVMKDKICGRLLLIFKSPPVSNYTQLPMLEQGNFNMSIPEEKINVKELDDAYLQKHNELMTVYKAYQNLFNVVLNYKDQLDKYKQLPTGSTISRTHMDKLIKDQGFVMDMIDKMQDQLVSKNIISNSEKVPVNPVTGNPENIGTFNNTMRDQIKHIIDRQVEVKPNIKTKIESLLDKYKDCDSNDKFCQAGRQLILFKKM